MFDEFQNWTVLKGDRTLKRAIRAQGTENVLQYQKEQLDIALSFCENMRHGIDIGANYGLMSYNMSPYFEQVSSFEIVPELNKCFKQNMQKFDIRNVNIYNCGLGDKEKEVAIDFDPLSTFRTHVDKDTKGSIKIKTLDSYNFGNVDFIKMDVEGYEPLVVKGGIKTIEKFKPVILYEQKGHAERFGYRKNIVMELLRDLKYRKLANVGSKNALIGVI
jgi:FkbM family methyltransferase